MWAPLHYMLDVFMLIFIGLYCVLAKISSILSKKKDSNKADAILIATFYENIIKNN